MHARSFSRHVIATGLIALLVAGCGDRQANAQKTGGMPPPEVAVVEVAAQPIAITTELPGRLEASRTAQVRARVPGIVLQRSFREGSDVKAGQLLFRIDPAPFRASFSSAQALLAKAEVNLAQASQKVRRYKPLVETNAISKQEFEDAVTAQKQAAADVAAARAVHETARLNLSYASVTAPIAGRIGRAQVTEGALVGQGEATPLATIQQLDPLYVNLTQSGTEFLQLQRALSSGKIRSAGKEAAGVTLLLEDGWVHPHAGKLLFSDLSVDPASGAVTLRAEIPNPERTLLPGMYVRARLEQGVSEDAIAVPQQAVQHTPAGTAVMVIAGDGAVTSRPVTLGTHVGNRRIVRSGLQAGETVMVEGFQKLRPGMPVKPVPWHDSDAQGNRQQADTPAPAAASPDKQTKAK